MAADSDWNNSSLLDAFYNGLADRIKDELAAKDLPVDLDGLVALSIRVDGRLRERRRERDMFTHSQMLRSQSSHPLFFTTETDTGAPSESPEPTQLGRTWLSGTERQRRSLRENKCMYCGQDGHFVH